MAKARTLVGLDVHATKIVAAVGVMARVTGHVRLVPRQGGPVWYAKRRGADGRQVQRKLGPAHAGRGRPLAGHYTERTAKEALEAILTDERRGTTAAHPAAAAGRWAGAPPAATFADAAAEFIRFIRDVRKRERSTVADYKGVIHGYLLDEFGDIAIDEMTPDHIDAYKEKLLAGWRRERGRDGSYEWAHTPAASTRQPHDRAAPVRPARDLQARQARLELADNPASADYVERPQ